MAQKRHKRSSGPPPIVDGPITDYGPEVAHLQDGRLRVIGGAARILIEDRVDPTISDRQQLVRGARRATTLLELKNRGVITKFQADAAERFLDDLSLATGSSSCSDLGTRVSSSTKVDMFQVALDAMTRVNQAMVIVRKQNNNVFFWTVFLDRGLREFDQRYRHRNGTGAGMLRDTLSALDALYEL